MWWIGLVIASSLLFAVVIIAVLYGLCCYEVHDDIPISHQRAVYWGAVGYLIWLILAATGLFYILFAFIQLVKWMWLYNVSS